MVFVFTYHALLMFGGFLSIIIYLCWVLGLHRGSSVRLCIFVLWIFVGPLCTCCNLILLEIIEAWLRLFNLLKFTRPVCSSSLCIILVLGYFVGVWGFFELYFWILRFSSGRCLFKISTLISKFSFFEILSPANTYIDINLSLWFWTCMKECDFGWWLDSTGLRASNLSVSIDWG